MKCVNMIKRAIKRLTSRKELIPIPQLISQEKLLQGKVALITGGSSGIGYSIAETFIEYGCKVIIASSNEEKLEKAAKKLEGVAVLQLDITDIASIKDKIKEACKKFDENRIDILVNSAGVHHKLKFEDVTEEEYDRIMDINLKGTFFISQAVGCYMRENGIKGHILNISSSSALRPAWGPYHMSKWGMRGFTLGLAQILQPHGIVVNSIAPGQTATEMLGKADSSNIYNDYALAGRYIMPQEIANLAVFLVSDIGKMIVGETVYITGGSGVITLDR